MQADYLEVPIFGPVGAGKVVDVDFSNRAATVTVLVPKGIARHDEIGSLTVSGDSLTGDGIFDGDLLIFRTNIHNRQITNHTICIVRILATGELLAKRLVRDARAGGQVALRSSGGNFPDRYFDSVDIEVVGIVFALQRLADQFGRLIRHSDAPF